MKKSKKQDVVLVKAVSASVAEAIRQAEIVRRDIEIDALDEHLVGLPLDIQRAARKAVRIYNLTVDEASRAAKAEAAKRRDAIAKEDRERRARFTYESEKSREEKAFSEALERINAAIENEQDPFLKGFLLSAIPEEPSILKDGSTPKVRKEKTTTEKTSTAKAPREGNRKAAIVEVLKNGASKTADIAAAIGSDTQTVSKYVSAYVKNGQWVKDDEGYVSLAHGTPIE